MVNLNSRIKGSPHQDLTGLRFGKLVVLSFAGIGHRKQHVWKCQCDCGGQKVVTTGLLNAGQTRSCGCLRPRNKSMTARLWSRLKVNELTSCWEWQGAKHAFGYGKLTIRGVLQSAPRVVYELLIGPVPENAFVLHRCDNPACCNPEHLYAGTAKDNMMDRAVRGRQKTKLTLAQARAIWHACQSHSESYGALGRRYGVTPATVKAIARGQTWVHAR